MLGSVTLRMMLSPSSSIFLPMIVSGSSILAAPVFTPILATSMKKMIRHMTTSISGVTLTPPSFISGMECFFTGHLLSGFG